MIHKNIEGYFICSVNYFQDISDLLQSKRSALEKYSELLNWTNGASQQLDHVKHQLDLNEPLEPAEAELQKIVNEIQSWTEMSRAIDLLCDQSNVCIDGKSARSIVEELSGKADALRFVFCLLSFVSIFTNNVFFSGSLSVF